MFIFFLILGIVPLFFWLTYFRNKDKNKEPWKRLILIVVMGGISVYVAAYAEQFISWFFRADLNTPNFFSLLFQQTFIVGVTEELVKFLVVWIFAFHSPDFDEPIDGLVYSAAAAIGFATVENAMYAANMGFQVWIMRIFLSTTAHIMFAAIWGFELGRFRFEHRGHIVVLILSIGIAAFCHGLFNTLVSHSYLWLLGIIFIAVVLWRIVKNLYRLASSYS